MSVFILCFDQLIIINDMGENDMEPNEHSNEKCNL